MVTIKSYSDLQQAKKLAEILPLESADMKRFIPADNEGEFIEEVSLIKYKSEYALFDRITDWNDTPYIPCWSLAALLSVLKDKITFGGNSPEGWFCCYTIKNPTKTLTIYRDSLVDACYEMILKLHELKML